MARHYFLAALIALPMFASAEPLFTNPLNLTINGSQVQTLPEFAYALLDVFLSLMYPVAVIIVMYAGFQMATAQGDQKKITAARHAVTAAAVGFGIIIASKGIQLAISSTIESLK